MFANAQSFESMQDSFDPVQDSFFEDPVLAQADKKEINFSDLPGVVQHNFYDSEYTEWQIERIFEETNDDQSVTYELFVSTETAEQVIKFDEYGNKEYNEY